MLSDKRLLSLLISRRRVFMVALRDSRVGPFGGSSSSSSLSKRCGGRLCMVGLTILLILSGCDDGSDAPFSSDARIGWSTFPYPPPGLRTPVMVKRGAGKGSGEGSE